MDADVFISLTHFKGHETHRLRRRHQEHRHGLRLAARARWSSTAAASPTSTRRSAAAADVPAPRLRPRRPSSSTRTRKACIDHDKLRGLRPLPRRLQLRRHRLRQRRAPTTMLNCKHGRVRQGRRGRPAQLPHLPGGGRLAPTATATARTTRPSCRTWACSPPSTRWPWTRPASTPAWPPPRSPAASSPTTWPRPASKPSDDHFTQLHPRVGMAHLPRARREDRPGNQGLRAGEDVSISRVGAVSQREAL